MLRLNRAGIMLACLAAWLPAGTAVAESPLGPGFTYNGRLISTGSPANGPHNFNFRLYDAAVGGNLLGSDAFDGVPVTDGLFTVVLNAGNELGLSAFNGQRRWLEIAVNDTPLAPRQELTATPYALFAAAPWSLNGTALSYLGGNVGIGLSNPPAPLTVQAAGNGLMHTDGTHALVTYTGGGGGWLGTFTAHPLHLFTGNGQARLTVDPAGNVGVGTTSPAQRLSVAGTVQSTSGGFMFPDGSVQTTASTGGGGFWTPSGINIFSNNAGNVGIGTSTPGARLAVINNSASGQTLDLAAPAKGSVYSHVHYGPSGDWYIRSAGVTGKVVLQDTGGNVGIGTSAPAFPLTIQTIDSIFGANYGWVHKAGDREVGSYVDSSGGWLGTRSNHPLYLFTNNSSPRVTLSTTGKLGVGTQSPICPLHAVSVESGVSGIYGVATSGTANSGVYGESTAPNGNGLIGQANNGSSAYGVWGRATNGIGGYFQGGSYAIYANGRVRVGVLEIAGADVAEKFPCSEPRADIEPGTVMEIDTENPGRLRIAREAYSTRVAGVVSGAGDLPVGAVLGHLDDSEDGPAIALSGRVWVACDASDASIAPGDLLTTSGTAGHAMNSCDRERAHGAILGKAMTSLDSGRGLVLVLVNLQ